VDIYKTLLRLLAQVEKSLQEALSRLLEAVRTSLLEMSTIVSREALFSIGTQAINDMMLQAKITISQHIDAILSAANEILSLQSVDTITRLSINDAINAFIESASAYIPILLTNFQQTVQNEAIDLTRNVFSKRITQDDASVFRKGGNGLALSTSIAIFTLANRSILTGYKADSPNNRKMAIAVTDDHTTDTCKRVNGQVVRVDKPFKLSGRPRFARLMDYPPFHYNCRTSMVLIRDKQDEARLLEQI